MVEKNSVEADVEKKKLIVFRNGCGWGCLISLVLIFAISSYFIFSAAHNMKVRGANGSAYSEAKSAYFYAKKFFADHPLGELSPPLLNQYGFQKSDKVTLIIVDGKRNRLKLQSEHQDGTKVYLVDHKGVVTIEEK